MTTDEAIEFCKVRIRQLAALAGGLKIHREAFLPPGLNNLWTWRIRCRVPGGDGNLPGAECPEVNFSIVRQLLLKCADQIALQDYIDQQWIMAMMSLWEHCNKDLIARNMAKLEEACKAEEYDAQPNHL